MNHRITDEVAIYLNELRSRSHASEIGASDVTLDLILKERLSELVADEYCGYTLVRTGEFCEWTLKYNLRLYETKGNTWNDLLPIPQSIIDANTGLVIVQNPGSN